MEESPIVPVVVKIFDKEYTVACPEGQEQALILSAKRVDQEMRQVRESGKVLGTDRIAVMVALNLAHELLNQQGIGHNQALYAETMAKVEQIQTQVTAALEQYQKYASG
ncbi:MAG: cell division protein ZapA [Thiothrix sp.]|nr:MAG: cell division protein ZapA [Thiothrix sp.]